MENALYSFYSLVVLYYKTHAFAAITRSFYDTSRLVNKNRTRALSMKYSLYVICRPGGPYWENCARGLEYVRSEAAGRGPYSRPRAQFLPIRTDLGRQITCLFFSSDYYDYDYDYYDYDYDYDYDYYDYYDYDYDYCD